jgi:hypothetical protein
LSGSLDGAKKEGKAGGAIRAGLFAEGITQSRGLSYLLTLSDTQAARDRNAVGEGSKELLDKRSGGRYCFSLPTD